MNCPLCGETCRCHSEPPPFALPLSRPEARDQADSVLRASPDQLVSAEPDRSTWRDEISARLTRYRARRKIRPPRYPSLRLQFGVPEPSNNDPAPGTARPAFDPVSDQALALDGLRQRPDTAEADVSLAQEPSPDAAPPSLGFPSGHSGAKILEFPRLTWTPPPVQPDQLAEPVATRPRILEVPEVAPAPPALGGITMSASNEESATRQPGVDVPLQSTSRVRRIFASAVDGLIVASASALFGAIFWKVAAVRPPLVQILALATGVPCLFWAAYQYLLIVYSATTPGWRLAGLKLTRFDGTATSRRLRRWRVLASCLSGAALGMGFAWALLDEDALCWHDRISRTCLARKGQRPSDASTSHS